MGASNSFLSWCVAGPATLHGYDDDQVYTLIWTDTDDPALQREVALVGAWDLEGERYACLIAAAPKLLAACQAVVERWEHGDLAEAARMCRNAVQEAAGGQPRLPYQHRYPTRCPKCNADLTAADAVVVHFAVAGQRGEAFSRLNHEGWLIDFNSVVAHGHHSGTVCWSCGRGLDEYEILDLADVSSAGPAPIGVGPDDNGAAINNLLAKAKAAGLIVADFDETVHELASSIAADVNNDGLEGQLRYLIAEWGGEAVAREIDRLADERSRTTDHK